MGANGPLTSVATAAPTPQRPVALSPGQELRGPTGNLLATAAEKAISTTPHWEATTQEVGGKPVAGWINLNAVDKPASFVAGSKPAEAKPHYSEVEKDGNVVIIDMNLPADQRLAKGQIKGPIRGNLKQIETNDAEGRPVTRWVDESTLAALGDIPKQYTGLLLEMAQAGQLKKGWESDPRVAGVIRDNLINQSGGITPAKFAELRVRIAESAAKLAYEGVPGYSVKDLTPSLSNLTTLPSGSSAPAPAAASKITTRAEIAETAKRSNKSIEEVTRDAVQKGFRVQ